MRHTVVIALALTAFTATAAVANPPPPRIGQRCDVHKRYAGFVCGQLSSGDLRTLFKLAQPGLAPATCPGITPTPTSVPPDFTSLAVGASPFWVHPGVKVETSTGTWHSADNNVLGLGGWAVKWLWQVEAGTAPVSVSITNLGNGRKLTIAIHGTQKSTAPVLDDSNALVVPANAWSSYVLFPGRGCYRLDAVWANGASSLVFSFGR